MTLATAPHNAYHVSKELRISEIPIWKIEPIAFEAPSLSRVLQLALQC
jgi:hypothetical protein